MLKMAVFAPMPKLSVKLVSKVNPGGFSNIRAPYRRSWSSEFINIGESQALLSDDSAK